MHFVVCTANEAIERPKTDIRKILNRIIDGKHPYVEIKDFEHKDANSCANALRSRIKKDRLSQLQVVTRNNRVFVINTLFAKEVK